MEPQLIGEPVFLVTGVDGAGKNVGLDEPFAGTDALAGMMVEAGAEIARLQRKANLHLQVACGLALEHGRLQRLVETLYEREAATFRRWDAQHRAKSDLRRRVVELEAESKAVASKLVEQRARAEEVERQRFDLFAEAELQRKMAIHADEQLDAERRLVEQLKASLHGYMEREKDHVARVAELEAARQAAYGQSVADLEAAGRAALEKAKQEERERCAQLAESYGTSRPPVSPERIFRERHMGECAASNGIANLIRARASEKP